MNSISHGKIFLRESRGRKEGRKEGRDKSSWALELVERATPPLLFSLSLCFHAFETVHVRGRRGLD